MGVLVFHTPMLLLQPLLLLSQRLLRLRFHSTSTRLLRRKLTLLLCAIMDLDSQFHVPKNFWGFSSREKGNLSKINMFCHKKKKKKKKFFSKKKKKKKKKKKS